MTKNNKIYSLLMIAIIISVGGFILENVFVSFTIGFIDNKNMFFPCLFAYGLGIVGMYLLFGMPQKPAIFGKALNFKKAWMGYVYYFIIAFVMVSVAEIVIGYGVEWTCDIIWWEYTTLPLHFTKYTSVPTSTAFAVIITLCVRYCFEPLLKFFSKFNSKAYKIITVVITIALLLDMVHSGIYMYENHNIFKIWRIDLPLPLFEVVMDWFR